VFASELRAQRQRLGWTQVVLGDKIGFSGSFVSDVERCERTPSLDFSRACDREMNTTGYEPETTQGGSFERLHELIRRDAYPAWFSPVIPFESKAVRIHGWELAAVPGLLGQARRRVIAIGQGAPHLSPARRITAPTVLPAPAASSCSVRHPPYSASSPSTTSRPRPDSLLALTGRRTGRPEPSS
jgi:transcriptional regulator with XRE-family HTH domain